MREIAYWSAIYEIEVFAIHIKRFSNEVADALSIWHLDYKYKIKFHEMIDIGM